MTEKEIKALDIGCALFQETVINDDLLGSYFRGFLSESEVGSRLSFLRMQALTLADKQLAMIDYEEQPCGDSGVA